MIVSDGETGAPRWASPSGVLELLPVGVLVQGSSAEILSCNARALDLLGLSRDQLLGRSSLDPAWNVIHADGSPFPGPTHPVPMALATGRSVRAVTMGVFRPVTQDRVWLLVDAEPVLRDGRVEGALCTFSEVTRLREVEEALRGSESRLRAIIENEPECVMVLDANGILLEMNPAGLA
jgi:PAS domain S-box-containing protein